MKESLHIQITVESFMRHKVFDTVVLSTDIKVQQSVYLKQGK